MKVDRQKFTEKIVGMIKVEKCYETQGRPIILSKVRENKLYYLSSFYNIKLLLVYKDKSVN